MRGAGASASHATPVDTRSPLLFNKTTCRDVYDDAPRAASSDVDDVLLWNARGELTESSVANSSSSSMAAA